MSRSTVLLCLVCLTFVAVFSQQLISPSSGNLSFMGRMETSSNLVYYFDWSGVEISFIVSGTTTLQVLMDTARNGGNLNMFTVLINNALYPPLNITSNSMDAYDIVTEGTLVASETYIISLVKRTEASLGIVGFYGILVDEGANVSPQSPPTRKLEFIGDSITCGYGIDGLAPCSFTPQSENNFDTYEYIISRQLDTQLHVECWSGKGLVRNYGYPNVTSPDAMPSYLPYVLATNETYLWDFSNYVPDAVVINLGTNDFSTQPYPPENLWEQAYIDLIQNNINTWYPNQPKVFLACGPMISGFSCDYVQSVAEAIESATYIDLQNILEPEDIGCDGHPNQSGHAKMAAIAFPIIQKVMGW